MNILQRIVLIVGAVALLVMLRLTGSNPKEIAGAIIDFWDWHSAIVRGAIISAATAAIYFAFGKSKK
jgi:hypothetical protein